MVAGTDDPAVQRRRLRQELRSLRRSRGDTQRDVAKEMDWSTSKLIRIESGDVAISVNDLRALLGYYEVGDRRQVDELLAIARTARKESWTSFRDVHSSPWLTFLGYESSATIIRHFDTTYVPGLLQTEEYARAVLVDCLGYDDKTVDGRWEARERRQQLHDRQEPPQMFFMLDEAVVRRPIGGRGIMRKQLVRLREANDLAHVTLRVVPFGVGGYRGLPGAFVYLEFADARDEDIVHIEQNPDGVTLRDTPEDTEPYLSIFFEMEDIALSVAETNTLLDQLISGESDKASPEAVAASEKR